MSSRQSVQVLNGQRTEVVVQTFADRILVLVTQMGKIANLVQASIPPTVPIVPAPPPDPSNPSAQSLSSPPAAIQLTPLMGSASSEHMQTLHSLYAAQAATIVWTAGSRDAVDVYRRDVVVGIALRKSDGGEDIGISASERTVFLGIMEMLRELVE